MQARCGTESILVGSRALLASRGIPLAAPDDDHSHVEVWVAGATPLGAIYLSDELRPEAKAVIARLHREGAAVTLLTGDRAAVANDIAASLGIRDVRAGLSPPTSSIASTVGRPRAAKSRWSATASMTPHRSPPPTWRSAWARAAPTPHWSKPT